MLVVMPSPKSQNRLVIVPVELSVKLTVSGLRPLVGLAVKAAAGTIAAAPITGLMTLIPVSVLKTTALLKLPAALGANSITRFVEPNPAKAKELLERMANPGEPAARTAVPLVSEALPRLVRTKLACTWSPTTIVPKSRMAGETASSLGVKPKPLSALMLLPPLLMKAMTLLEGPALVGAKLTITSPVCPGATAKSELPSIAKGGVVDTVP